ncbi:MAG: crotonase/enoyl-CoA hydratase family protein [Gammaproteobacteria bacterium]|nr:crotonase/enoyl-CoA hydratase family protein [Gammaproteobacteria bacterium]
MNYETLNVSESDKIVHIELNRPDKANAINDTMWRELKRVFEWLDRSKARVGVLSARGKHFSAGIDFEIVARKRKEIEGLTPEERQQSCLSFILELQQTVNAAENCSKPIIAAIQGACIGGGLNLVSACDMRYASVDTRFSIKEVDLAIVADLGSLQRLPRIIGEGLTRELAYTGREVGGEEAMAIKLVNRVLPDRDSLIKAALDIAADIASKSPATVRGIKRTLNFNLDHSLNESLAFVAAKNASLMFSADFDEMMLAAAQKRHARFKD